MSEDRRQYPRVQLEATVQLPFPRARTRYPVGDISAGGVFVLARAAPPMGSAFDAQLTVGDVALRAPGRVVRTERTSTRTGFALQFDVDGSERDQLWAAIELAISKATPHVCMHLSLGQTCGDPTFAAGLRLCALHAQLLLDSPQLPIEDDNHALQQHARRSLQ